MKRPLILPVLVLALVGVAVLGGCSSLRAKTGGGPPPVRVGIDGDNATVSLVQGQQLIVSLPANPSTGFAWEVAAIPGHIAADGAPAFTSGAIETSPALVGASGEMAFTFLATGNTSGVLELAYRRPWEKKPAARTYRLTVNVK